MKIFNIQPIKVAKYIFNEEHLIKSSTDFSSEFGFAYTGRKIESLNTLIITFNFLCYAGKNKNVFITYDNDSQFNFESDEGSEDLLFSYDSYCQFNFESEGFETDVLSITEFLAKYYTHTEDFFQRYGFKTIKEIEEKIGLSRGLELSALSAIDSLRANNVYEF